MHRAAVAAEAGLRRTLESLTLADLAIFRLEKGAVGILHADGPDAPELYAPVK